MIRSQNLPAHTSIQYTACCWSAALETSEPVILRTAAATDPRDYTSAAAAASGPGTELADLGSTPGTSRLSGSDVTNNPGISAGRQTRSVTDGWWR